MNKNRKPTHFSPFQSASHYQAELFRDVEVPRLTQCAFGTLTHILPLVCWRFHRICRLSDGLWYEAMYRLSCSSPDVWGSGASKLTQDKENGYSSDIIKPAAVEVFGKLSIPASGEGKLAFQRAVVLHQPFTVIAPIMSMNGSCTLAQLESLWFQWGPQHRFMMNYLMRNRPFRETTGDLIASPRPRFLLSPGLPIPLILGDRVFIVELRQCKFERNGDSLVKMAFIRQARIKVLPKPIVKDAHILSYATVEPLKREFQDARLPVIGQYHATGPYRHLTSLYCSVDVEIWEERYVRMIRELMTEWGESPTTDRPIMVINRYTQAEANGVQASLVEIRTCAFIDGTSANMQVIPLAKCRLRNVVERPNREGQFDANIEIVA